ncbi:hypothetical protein SB781_03085 [Paraburkholderia sp. SIMBA_061]
MNIELQIIRTYGPGVFLALVLIGLATYGLKALFSVAMGWLSKRVGRKLEDDAARYRHELAKDMEAYKNDLSRALNVERIRSEVRRAAAEKLLDMRLKALHEVHLQLWKLPSWVTSIVRFPYELRRDVEFSERMELFTSAMDSNGLYFTNLFGRDYRLLAGTLFELAAEWRQGAVFENTDARFAAVIVSTARLQTQIEQKHRLLPDEISALMIEQPPFAIADAGADRPNDAA